MTDAQAVASATLGLQGPQVAVAMTSVAGSSDPPPGVPDPKAFRQAWRALDPLRRERLTQLVTRGRPAQDPSDASLAAGLARRTKRHYAWLLFIAPVVIVAFTLGFAALVNRFSDPMAHISLVWALAGGVVVAVFVEVVGLLSWIRARRAERINTRLAQEQAPDQPLPPLLRRFEPGLEGVEQAFDLETRRRGEWHCPRCGRRIPNGKAPPTTAIGGHWLQPPEGELVAACEQDHRIRMRRR